MQVRVFIDPGAVNYMEAPHLDSGRLTRSGRTRAPALDWRIIFKIVEAQIRRGQHLREHDDLAGVHREVFGDVEDGFEEFNVVALDLAELK